MKCVADTSAISWLGRIDYLDLLNQLYEKIYAPEGVFRELESHKPVKEFLESHVIPITFKTEKERRRFDRLVKRWNKKVDLEDVADLEVFIGYKFFTDTNEALYANKDAKEKLSLYGIIRDIAKIYELAEEKRIFNKEDSIKYLENLLKLDYRTPYIIDLLTKLKRS